MPVQQLAVVSARSPSLRAIVLGATALALATSTSVFAGPDINVSQTVNASSLGANDTPNFNGGTLKVDAAGPFAQNFTLQPGASGAASLSTIDENGKSVIFSGVFSNGNTSTGQQGSIVFTDSMGGGNVTLNASNTYTGDTTINSGATLRVGSSGYIGLSDLVNVIGTLDISQASASGVNITTLAGSGNVVLGSQVLGITAGASTFTGVISGAGGLVLTAGAETLSGNNTYTGGTAITSGTLTVGAGGSSGTILGNVSDNGTLAFNRSDNVSFTGTITGTGGLSQVGAGTLTLTNTDTYTGATNVAAGTLALSSTGNISSSSNVTVGGIFDISATSGTSIKSLAGTGTGSPAGRPDPDTHLGVGHFLGLYPGQRRAHSHRGDPDPDRQQQLYRCDPCQRWRAAAGRKRGKQQHH